MLAASKFSDMLIVTQGDPVEVLPWLYIGNAYHASCEDRLMTHGISALLNMADSAHDDVTTTTTSGVDRKRLCHVNIAVADSCSADISFCFPQAIDLIGQLSDIIDNDLTLDAHCCHMGTAIKHPVPDRARPSFVIFDIRAL